MKAEYAQDYGNFERTHWWFRARRVILKGLLDRYVPWQPGLRAVEIGTGPGENLYALYPPDIALTGVEPDAGNAAVAGARGPVPVHVGTLEKLPAPVTAPSQELVCLFDVLEHIEDDEAALDRLAALLVPGGWLALSVPAFQWMWGQQDVVNMHYRRYTRPELCRKLERHGFEVVRSTYFCSMLFLPIALIRLLAKFLPKKDRPPRSDFEYPVGPLNEVFYRLFRLEQPLLKFMNLPFGSSCFAIARKKS